MKNYLSLNPSPQGREVTPLSLWGGAGGEVKKRLAMTNKK